MVSILCILFWNQILKIYLLLLFSHPIYSYIINCMNKKKWSFFILNWHLFYNIYFQFIQLHVKICANIHNDIVVTIIELVFALSIRMTWYKTKLELSKLQFVNVDLRKLETQYFESLRRITTWKMRIVFQVVYFER